jgi:LPXTG-motif cell wall-anchored protein
MRPVRLRSAPRALLFISTPLLVIALSLIGLGGIASAHVVTSMTADCYGVTVHFSDFPASGVIVHIAIDVNGQEVGSDALITNANTEAHVDIAAATTGLLGGAAHIDVDVTWTYLGPQHVHESFTETCGAPPATTTSTTPTESVATTTTAAPPTTTTQVSTTTTMAKPTTSTQVKGTTITATTSPPTTSKGTVGVLGTTVASTTTTVPAIATLPRTGSSPMFPVLFGSSSVVAGALLLVRQRRTAGPTNDSSGCA